MLKSTALNHFGTGVALSRALGISTSAVTQWGDVVPYASAKRLAEIAPTLHIVPSMYDERLHPIPQVMTRSRKRAA
jgi:DNA-binding transcriptional regulator YdaS (Cro superfamily)